MPAFREADNKRVSMRDGKMKRGPMGGWDAMRQRIIGENGKPMIYCFSTCVASIRTIPVLQHDPARAEDLDTTAEDHCFAAGTMVETDRGPVPIEHLPLTGWVLSSGGYRRYRSARMTRKNAPIVRVTFEDGRSLLCTPDHRFVVDLNDWRYASDLVGASVLCAPSSSATQSKSLMESDITCVVDTFSAGVKGFISQFGNIIGATFRPAAISIMRTMTAPTTGLAISNVFPFSITSAGATEKRAGDAGANPFQWQMPLQRHGTVPMRDRNGTQSILSRTSGQQWNGALLRSVRNAARATWLALRGSRKANSADQTAARVRCVSVEGAGKTNVYCLTVPSTGCFAIEGGILVSNCADDWRYGCMSRPWTRSVDKDEAEKRDAYQEMSEVIGDEGIKLL